MTFPECSTQSGCRPPDPLSIDEVEIALHKATFGNKRCPGCSKENWLELNVARQCCQPSATSDKARQRRFSRSQHACSFPTIVEYQPQAGTARRSTALQVLIRHRSIPCTKTDISFNIYHTIFYHTIIYHTAIYHTVTFL